MRTCRLEGSQLHWLALALPILVGLGCQAEGQSEAGGGYQAALPSAPTAPGGEASAAEQCRRRGVA